MNSKNQQNTIDSENAVFWDELCGTLAAKSLGINDDSPASLAKFDEWYFNFYPYLKDYINIEEISDKAVLEIGLGYGTLGYYLSHLSKSYVGLDIADAPVSMMRKRLRYSPAHGRIIKGSILEPPLDPNSFDVIYAIGSLHHTGNLKLAIDKCYELLRPGGKLVMMVYYAYSYRRFEQQRRVNWHYWLKELFGFRGSVGYSDSKARMDYDKNSSGHAAPETDWISKRSIAKYFKDAGFSEWHSELKNMDQSGPYYDVPRELLLGSIWERVWGLDLYSVAYK